MYKAIIFDLFGVIHVDPYQRWLNKHGFKREGAFYDASRMADLNLSTMEEFFETLHKLSNESVESIRDNFYEDKFADESLTSLIKRLKGNYKIGLLTNSRSDYSRSILDSHNLTSLFDEIIISSEVGVIKPDRKIFELTLQKMNISADQTIFIDDNQSNVEAASALGIKSIWYKDLATLKEELAKLGINYQ